MDMPETGPKSFGLYMENIEYKYGKYLFWMTPSTLFIVVLELQQNEDELFDVSNAVSFINRLHENKLTNPSLMDATFDDLFESDKENMDSGTNYNSCRMDEYVEMVQVLT